MHPHARRSALQADDTLRVRVGNVPFCATQPAIHQSKMIAGRKQECRDIPPNHPGRWGADITVMLTFAQEQLALAVFNLVDGAVVP